MTDPDAVLSPRQRAVIAGLAAGLDQQEIAAKLGISPWTVGNYVESARQVLHARTTAHLVALAVAHGLVTVGVEAE